MLPEMILSLLCIVSLTILLWDLVLQIKLKKLERKIKAMEERKTIKDKR